LIALYGFVFLTKLDSQTMLQAQEAAISENAIKVQIAWNF